MPKTGKQYEDALKDSQKKREAVYFTPRLLAEKLAEYQREYRKNNPDRIKKHIDKYRETHQKEYRKYIHDYYKNNRERIERNRKIRRQRELARLEEKHRGRKRRLFMRSEIIKKLGKKCAICGHSDPESLLINDKIHMSRYRPNIQRVHWGLKKGRINLENFQLVCGNCNVKKFVRRELDSVYNYATKSSLKN